MSVLTETEIARLAGAYDELIAEASDDERPWWQLAKAIVLVALGTALRRGELIGLRWSAVNLLEAKIEVRETFVRGSSPRRRARHPAASSNSARARSPCSRSNGSAPPTAADDDLVFGHPTKGTPVETSRLAKRYLKPALARAGIDEAVPAVPRPPAHLADARRRRRQPADLRPGARRPLAGIDHRAVHARGAGPLPGRRREERGAHVRCAADESET